MARRKKKQTVVQILNPLPGHASYTSFRNALELVGRNRAAWDGPSLVLLSASVTEALTQQEHKKLMEYHEELFIVRARKGKVFWNGADRSPFAMHQPGEVRS